MDEDTEVWFEALAGRAAEDRRGAAREAHALRAAMLRQRAPEPAPARARDASREAALLERARRAGLIPQRHRSRLFTRERLASWPALGLYTALACSVLVASILWRSPRPTEVVRGAPEKIVTLRVSNPIALKRALLDELRTAGVKARGYERLGVEGIDADLPVPVPARVRAVLDRHHIATPADATLRVEIVSTAP